MKPTTSSFPRRSAPGLVAIAVLLGGCANALYFGTDTSGGLKVSGTRSVPTQVGLSYQRSEIAILPPGKDGSTPAVFGGSDHDYSWQNGIVLSQTFATGPAAEVAVDPAATPAAAKNQGDTMLFTTGTKFGLDLSLGDSAAQSPSLIVGYRRSEGVIMPLKEDANEANATYADISIVYDENGSLRKNLAGTDLNGKPRDAIAADRLPNSGSGVRIKQQFATGSAAVKLVQTKSAREKLFDAAGLDFGSLPEKPDAVAARLQKVTDAAAQQRLVALATTISAEHGIPAPSGFDTLIAGWVNAIPPAGLDKFVHDAGNDLP